MNLENAQLTMDISDMAGQNPRRFSTASGRDIPANFWVWPGGMLYLGDGKKVAMLVDWPSTKAGTQPYVSAYYRVRAAERRASETTFVWCSKTLSPRPDSTSINLGILRDSADGLLACHTVQDMISYINLEK